MRFRDFGRNYYYNFLGVRFYKTLCCRLFFISVFDDRNFPYFCHRRWIAFLDFLSFWQLGASSAYFGRNDMHIGRIPIGVSLYLLLFSIGLIILFIYIYLTEEKSWDLASLIGLAFTVVLTVGLPTYGVFWTFYYELNWNENEVINRSIFLRRNKPRHFYFEDIIDVAEESAGLTLTFKDGSKLIINRSMAGKRELLAAVEPFFRNL